MIFVLRFHAEITVKSKSLRQRYSKVLTGSIRNLMKAISPEIKVRNLWDKLEVETPEVPEVCAQVLERLQNTPGISHIEQVENTPFESFEQLLEFVIDKQGEHLVNRSFAVRVKRKGKHEFSSQDLAAYIGGGIKARVEGTRVQLKNPEQTVKIWLEDDQANVEIERFNGLGGYPIPTQETVISLISGGFDSAVATYALMRRGARTHFCFFNLGGAEAHEAAVKEVSYFIWEKFSKSHPVKFVSIDFSEVVDRILTQDQPGLMGVLLKRAMLRAASIVASRLNAQAIVTGEALGQVSSQTLTNLQVIDEVTDTLVLRPLIVSDKQDIVDLANSIGVGEMAAAIPEYCGVISNKPTVKAQRGAIKVAEETLTDELIESVVLNGKLIDVRNIPKVTQEETHIRQINDLAELNGNELVLDIRAPEEEELNPLVLSGSKVQHLPFFKLARAAEDLDKSQPVVLYCKQGVMSRLQAITLRNMGFTQVAVLADEAVCKS